MGKVSILPPRNSPAGMLIRTDCWLSISEERAKTEKDSSFKIGQDGTDACPIV